ncbi:MAG: Na+/H+ antiporter NhaA [Planctomyces sp.]|nr:Na+/H+ antiporter NhaA [Planctomyces sp.]
MADKNTKSDSRLLPEEPIHRLTRPLTRFLHVEAASGIVLLLCAIVAFSLANSAISKEYLALWKTPFGLHIGDFLLEHPLKHWINDGLMAIFFFVIGLEVKREFVLGELRSFRNALLPIVAALGGMIVPAGLFLALQFGESGQQGWGIPMATDIAFVVGCLAVLDRRVPGALRVILLSIAIVDDIGAIAVIAIGYTEALHISWLAAGVVGILLILLLQRVGVRSIGMYTLIGAAIWLCFHESGIHATIAGVILGVMTPANSYLERGMAGELKHRADDLFHGGPWDEDLHRAEKIKSYRRIARETVSPLEYLIYVLHPWVAFVIMPLFALANAGVPFEPADTTSSVAIAVMIGLVVGKPLGILGASWLALTLKLVSFPTGLTWRHLIGGSFLAGIGFTMALFIAELAFRGHDMLYPAKVGVLVGSLISAIVGIAILAPGKSPTSEE